MKKSLFAKIGSLFLGLSMGLGVVAGVASKGASEAKAETITYTHDFTTAPGSSGSVTLSTVNWTASNASNLGSYNSGNYKGVQLGTSSKTGSYTLTTSNAWGEQSTASEYYGKTKITKIYLWMNAGAAGSISATVKIGGTLASSDGTTVAKNSSASSQRVGTTKVTYTPSSGFDTGVIEITYSKSTQNQAAGYFCSIQVECEEATSAKTLESITIGGSLGKTEYTTNDLSFDTSSITVSANYSDNSTADVTADATLTTTPEAPTEGTTSVTINASYNGKSDSKTFNGITVNPAPILILDELKNIDTGNLTSYTNWSNVSKNSQAIYAGYSSGSTTSDYIQINSKNGYGIVSTRSGGLIRQVSVEFNSKTTLGKSIDVYGKASKYTSSNELFEDSCGTLLGSITYGSSTLLRISDDYPFVGLRAHDGAIYMTSVSFSWEGTSVEEKTLTSISITTPPTKIEYTEGDTLDTTGIVVTGTYDDSSEEVLTDECTFSPTTLTEISGSFAITVTHTASGLTTAFNVKVNAKPAAPIYNKITNLNVADKVVITTIQGNNKFYLPTATTSNAPTAETAVISNDQLTNVYEENLFTVSKDANGNFAFQNADGKYLKNNSTSDGVRINSSSAVYWTVTATANGFKMTNNSRWLGVYSTDWRSYDSSTGTNYGGSGEAINFYGIEKEIAPLELIEVRDYPTSDMEIGQSQRLSYYGLDSEGENWTGDVTYLSSNTSVATITDGNLLTAVGAGTTDITVCANAGVDGAKVESESITITVLANPERIDLPVGTYSVTISAIGMTKTNYTLPESSYEIKEKDGRTWYKDLSVSYNGLSVSYSNEYTLAKETGSLLLTNNSNAKITSVSIDWYISGKYAESNVFVGSSTTPAGHSEISGGQGTIYIYTLNTSETISIVNPSVENASSFYTMTINFEVKDESEDFLSLVVSKGEGWNKTSYVDGKSPVADGLIVTANYTMDGSTISRSEDVTADVTNWSFNPSKLKVGDTSFTVTVSWSGYTSQAFIVTGITVVAPEGPLANGRYYIMTANGNYGINAEFVSASSKNSPTAVDLSTNNELKAFNFKLVDNNEYQIYTPGSGGGNCYLINASRAISGNNDRIRITDGIGDTDSISWVLEEVAGGYTMKQNTTGSTWRYLSCYNSQDWRGYLNTDNGEPVLKFVAEDSLAKGIANSILNIECDDGVTPPSVEDWNAIAAEFINNVTIAHEKALLTGGAANASSTSEIEKALAKYDYIVGKYGSIYQDFLDRNPVSLARHGLTLGLDELKDSTWIVAIVAIAGLTAIGGCFFYRKRKEN